MKMNEMFAIEPTAFSNAPELKYFLEKFGFDQGRMIAAYPKKWIRLVYEHFDQFSEMERKRAEVLLLKYREERVFPCGVDYQPNRSWLANVTEQCDKGVFADAIVAKGNVGRFRSLENVDDEYFSGLSSRAERVIATAEEYVRIAAPLIRFSDEIILVDPYFHVWRPMRAKVVVKFAEQAKAGRCRKITIFTRDEGRSEKWINEQGGKLFADIPEGVEIVINVVNDENSPNKMHARYLLSLKGGIRFDKGFEEVPTQLFVDIEMIDRFLLNELLRLFDSREHGFHMVHTLRFN